MHYYFSFYFLYVLIINRKQCLSNELQGVSEKNIDTFETALKFTNPFVNGFVKLRAVSKLSTFF
jgi:hypothetical protein